MDALINIAPMSPIYTPHQKQVSPAEFCTRISTDGVRAPRRPASSLSIYKPLRKHGPWGWPCDPCTHSVPTDPQAISRALYNLRQLVKGLLNLLLSAFLARLYKAWNGHSSRGRDGVRSGNRTLRALTDPRDLTGEVVPDPNRPWPIAGGGFANIYLAIWPRNGREIKVAVKVLKLPQYDSENPVKTGRERLYKELSIWARLQHRNILPLYGVTSGFGPPGTSGLVCRWVKNGDLTHYLTKYKLSSVERLQILKQIGDGISYLHSNDVVHGDLTGNNILIGDDSHVFICDFGLSAICNPAAGSRRTTSVTKFNIQWTAPEIILSYSRPTKSTDVYSLASIMLQVFTGRTPYHGRTDGWIIIHIHSGNHHPPRPLEKSLIPTEFWKFMLRCWATLPRERPSVTEIYDFLSFVRI